MSRTRARWHRTFLRSESRTRDLAVCRGSWRRPRRIATANLHEIMHFFCTPYPASRLRRKTRDIYISDIRHIQFAKSTTRRWADRRPPRTAVEMRPNGEAEWRAATPSTRFAPAHPRCNTSRRDGTIPRISTALASGRDIVPMRRTSASRCGELAAPLRWSTAVPLAGRFLEGVDVANGFGRVSSLLRIK